MRRQRSERGSQAVEFAIVVPVLLAITAAIVDYGWYYSNALSVIQGAREGARTGAAHDADDAGTACSIAESATLAALQSAGFTCDASAATGSVTLNNDTGEMVLSVTATIPYEKLWGLVPTPASMVGKVTVRLEDQENGSCSF